MDLVSGDNPTDDRRHPVVIRGNQRSSAVIQLQCRISQCIGNAILSKLWANRPNNDPLWWRSFNNEAADHHVVASLDEGARADISQRRFSNGSCSRGDGTYVATRQTTTNNGRRSSFFILGGWRLRIFVLARADAAAPTGTVSITKLCRRF